MFVTDDTIAAISTAAGSAARAIVRASGPRAIECAATVFTASAGRLADCGGFRAIYGIVTIPSRWGVIELPARAYVFRAPRSYTRQDICELHVPGPAAVATALLEKLIASGARAAGPGEFTARAFFAGRIDLSAAEGVADIIHAEDDSQLRSGLAALGGRTHRLCRESSAEIADVLAAVEASIDLADENIQLDSPADLACRLGTLAGRLDDFARQAADLPETTDRPHVGFAGRPNVGKSSLLNALCGTDRAIVSATAGTTRDVLSSPMQIGGTAVVLQDAAGFGSTSDALQSAGEQAARAALAAADVIVFVIDAAEDRTDEDRALLEHVRAVNRDCPLIMLANKIDRLDGSQRETLIDGCHAGRRLRFDKLTAPSKAEGPACSQSMAANNARHGTDFIPSMACDEALPVSAVSGEGLEGFKARLADLLHLSAARGGTSLGLHQRQKRCLLAASAAAVRAGGLLDGSPQVADVAELASIELREALAQLGQISGQVATEDILGRIFARFCVGK